MQTRALKPQEHTHTHDGKEITITTRILISQDKRASCCKNIVARFTFRGAGKIASQRLGELHSSTVDKTHSSDQETWQRQVLSVPDGYKGDLRTHSSEKDAIQDREKVMLLLHDQNCVPRSDLPTEAQQLLTEDQVHYIDKLWVEKQYIGTGLGTLLLQSYLDALTKLEKGFAFTGPVVLGPAPMNVKDSEYDDGMKKLIQSYTRSGFEVWIEPDFQLRGPIAVMGTSI